ncbi:ribosomal RNA-processing protein 7-domain-containing protein [Pterulicium gracile]|uniref:Ribosomal RNA-processing protein 7-domain-containing protein n=1 Tax=Pterulicium gracile TaxID=1884261 RepID=A0A5C3QZS3_9AGAR|nr:ribosomal RNA-processing protein 7-domain-containing protein [Pterula gracilis]
MQNLISGFTVIPVSYPRTSTHHLYAREHTPGSKETSLPAGRTLFLVNLPPDATEREISLFFKPSGTVEKVFFDLKVSEPSHLEPETSEEEDSDEEEVLPTDDRPRKRRKAAKDAPPIVSPLPSLPSRTLRKTGQCAHVTFLDAPSIQNALGLSKKRRPWPLSDEPNGLGRYAALHDALRPPLDAVKEYADTSMALFDYLQNKAKRGQGKYRKGEAIVDEDGFTLVVRGGAYGQTVGGGVGVADKNFAEEIEAGDGDNKRGKGRKRKEKKEKVNFYAFQKAEKQRKELLGLRQRFEADKAKVEKLKQSRRFRPY